METTTYELGSLNGKDILAIVLSLFAPGLGHVVLGQTLKGLTIFALVLATLGVGYLVGFVAALDAYLVAKALKCRTVGLWETFPEYRGATRV